MTDGQTPEPSGEASPEGNPQHHRHHRVLFTVLGILVVAVVVVLVVFVRDDVKTERRQEELEPFYQPPDPLPSREPGTLLRSEPLGTKIDGGTAQRILYVSEQLRADGKFGTSVSSGMVLIPDSPAPAGGRTVLAWAHGTLGLGDKCAPSRAATPFDDMTWATFALQQGWVVAATDYSGLGTPGVSGYLVGQSEARDVINSVRAAAQLRGADTSERYLVYGHSQGGHTALWTTAESEDYAPELELVAAAAAAPAAELVELVKLQWSNVIAWVITPSAAVDWPLVYPELEIEPVLTGAGLDNYERLATDCIKTAALEGDIRQKFLRQDFFKSDPTENLTWEETLEAQSAPVPAVPTIIAQGTQDIVVIPSTTASYVERSCAAGAPLSQLWLGETGHTTIAEVAGPEVIQWLAAQLEGSPPPPNCEQQAPAKPDQGS